MLSQQNDVEKSAQTTCVAVARSIRVIRVNPCNPVIWLRTPTQPVEAQRDLTTEFRILAGSRCVPELRCEIPRYARDDMRLTAYDLRLKSYVSRSLKHTIRPVSTNPRALCAA